MGAWCDPGHHLRTSVHVAFCWLLVACSSQGARPRDRILTLKPWPGSAHPGPMSVWWEGGVWGQPLHLQAPASPWELQGWAAINRKLQYPGSDQ